jgi:hypothetical protein
MEMTAANAKKAIEAIKYVKSPQATKDAIMRLKYWRQCPSLSDGMKAGADLAMSEGEWNKFKGFLIIDQALNKANVELMLLKRLNYISLWTTMKAMVGEDYDDRKAVKEAKV